MNRMAMIGIGRAAVMLANPATETGRYILLGVYPVVQIVIGPPLPNPSSIMMAITSTDILMRIESC